MQTNITKLTIKSYLDFTQLRQEYQGSHEEHRLFALKHKTLLETPIKMAMLWTNQNLFRLKERPNSESFSHYFNSVSNLLGFLFFIMGFLGGIGLLSYSGHAPVNIIYYLLFAMVIPLVSMLMTLFSMMSGGNIANFFNLFFSLHWVEKFMNLFAFSSKVKTLNRHFPSSLKKWMFLHRLQLFSLLFSIGLLLSLLLMVISKDIAFSWSTTLKVTPVAFHEFLTYVGKPWEFFFPNAIPSIELVEMSQYFRLGETLNHDMVQNANKLGGWWQFLAMVTLVYAIILRFFLWLVSGYGYQKQLKKDFLALEGMPKLIREFQTPYVTTEAPKVEKHLEIVETSTEQIKEYEDKESYDNIIGWNFSFDEMVLINDNKAMQGTYVQTVGGSHTFHEDQQIASRVSQTVLLYVKSWEPPTMDFVDFLELLIENKEVDEIQVYPLGIAENYYKNNEKEVAVWQRKIQSLESKKVWVIDV